MNVIDWINIGEVSAERDNNLHNYFFDAGISETVVRNSKQFLLLGRKGAGKSALFSYLSSQPRNLFNERDLVVALSLPSYNWNAHFILADPQRGGSAAQRDSWRFVIAVESIRALFLALDNPPSPLREAHSLLERLFSKPVPRWIDILGGKLFTLARLKLPSGSFNPTTASAAGDLGEVSFNDVKGSTDLKTQLSKNLSNLTEYLERQLVNSLSHRKVFLVFDRLDESWLESSIKESKEIITGLINASEHALSFYGGNIRPLVFLREDIFSTLELNDKNKLRIDCGSVLMWTTETLTHMLKARIDYYATRAGQQSPPDLGTLFDRKTMRGKTTPLSYILARTFYRPRDVVAFFTMIVENAKRDAPTERIATKSVYEAESSYSDYVYNELLDEWRTQQPLITDYLAVFENIGVSTVTSLNIEKAFRDKLAITDRSEVRSVLRFLFDNSIIGLRVGKSSQWRYQCTHPHQRFVDAEDYRVHPGLKKRLGLKDSTREDDEV